MNIKKLRQCLDSILQGNMVCFKSFRTIYNWSCQFVTLIIEKLMFLVFAHCSKYLTLESCKKNNIVATAAESVAWGLQLIETPSHFIIILCAAPLEVWIGSIIRTKDRASSIFSRQSPKSWCFCCSELTMGWKRTILIHSNPLITQLCDATYSYYNDCEYNSHRQKWGALSV